MLGLLHLLHPGLLIRLKGRLLSCLISSLLLLL
jgi:hypothetical protein